MNNLTIFNSNELLHMNLLKKNGIKAAITDYGILKGGFVSSYEYIGNTFKLKNRIGTYWANSKTINPNYATAFATGMGYNYPVDTNLIGIRPVISLTDILSISKQTEQDLEIEIEFGEYPQEVATIDLQVQLEMMYNDNKLNSTGKTYFDNSDIEYEYNGKKYVRIEANFYHKEGTTLSNGKTYKNGDYVWVEVQPIRWLVSLKEDKAITKDIVIAGIPYNKDNNYSGKLEDSTLYQFINNIFAREIEPSKKSINSLEESSVKKMIK